MLTASRSLRGARHTGELLPPVPALAPLREIDFTPRRGQLLMVAGMPGAQKSGLSLWLAKEWRLPTLYFSADQDAWTTMTRLAASLTGHTSKSVADGLNAGADDYYLDELDQLPISFCFDTAPTLDDISQELSAYVELHDEWPQVIVIDNLINVQIDHDNEWMALRLILEELQAMARLTGAAVVVLHHMAEGDPSTPAPRKALHGKVTQRPEMILSLAFDQNEGALKVAVVKHRGGRADASGKTFARLSVDAERTRFGPYVGWNRPTAFTNYYEED